MTAVAQFKGFLTRVSDALKGEPARVIGYGSAVVIYFVANFIGAIPDVTFESALLSGAAAIAVVASVIESIRHYVSPVGA